MLQVEKTNQICNQLQIWSGFLRMRDNFLVMMEITQNNRFLFHVSKRSKDMLRQDMRILRADLASTAFGKNTAVYGHIDENGLFVRNWPVRKIAITDKMGKNGRLSVKIQTFRTRFYGQMLRKASSVRKMRFAYGQINKKWYFVRKFGLNCLSSTVFKNAEQKQSQSDHLHSAFHLIQVKSGTFSNPFSTNPLRQFF